MENTDDDKDENGGTVCQVKYLRINFLWLYFTIHVDMKKIIDVVGKNKNKMAIQLFIPIKENLLIQHCVNLSLPKNFYFLKE